ncbi:hypothetical protein UFOVP665_49 [uncultured Caudovirales phage]|uniref:Uncharacterized protein n=1 Tax=uncultured Caudovirales phage TaxID=2100421 RepID=A0A6J5NEI0_9CAUD|nr:hypothetical protein UFOVP665_49 [uncultured Caudovirales phage]
MTLPDIEVFIRPASSFVADGTSILGTVKLGALLGATTPAGVNTGVPDTAYFGIGTPMLLGPAQAAFINISGSITDVSIHRGRTRAIDSFDTGTATCTFIDETGQFNPDNTSSSLYPYVLPMRQFRISATVGSTVYQLFNGYTTRYTYNFEPGINATLVTIEAEDAFRVLNMSRVSTIASAVSGDYSGTRIGYILNALNVTNSIRDLATGNTQVDSDPDTDRTGLEAIQQVESAEVGAFFVDKRGFYTFKSRQGLQLLAAGVTETALTFNETTGLPYTGVQVGFDDQQIINYISIEGESLSGSLATDTESITDYFNRSLSKTGSLLLTDAEALNQANYLLGFRRNPKVTLDSIDFNVTSLGETARTNLSTNPSFETNTTSWSSGQSSYTVSTVAAYSGTKSLQVIMSSPTDSNIGNTTVTAPTAGRYVFSMYVYIPTTSTLAGRTVSVDTEGGTATVSSVSQSNATLVAGSWVRFSVTKDVTVAGTLVLVARLSGSLLTIRDRTNLCNNPSFETNSSGYGNISGTTLARVADTWGRGTQVLQVTCTNATATGTFIGNNGVGAYPVTGGLTYAVSLYAKHISGTARDVNVIYLWSRPTGNTYGGSGATVTLSATPQRVSATGVAPANATGLTIWVQCYSSGTTTAADVSQWDMVLLEESSTVNSYFDGNTTGATWTGTTNNSTSTLPRINLCPNPSFESNNTTSWSPYLSSFTATAGTIAGGTGSYSATSIASGTAAYGPFFQYSTPTVGTSLTISAYCLRTVGTRSYRWDMQFYNGGTFLSATSGTASTCATSTRLSATGTVPANTTNVLIILNSTGTGAISDAHQIDSVLLEESSTLNSYFDGSTDGGANWTGTVNNSTSITAAQRIYLDSAMFEQSSTADTYFDGSVSPRGFTSWTGTAHGSTSTMLSDAESVVNAELLDPVTVTKNYANGTISRTLTIQGITHSITPANWDMTFELAEPVGGDGLVLDSANQGILDTNILVY